MSRLTQKRVHELLTYNEFTGDLFWKIKKSGMKNNLIAGSINSKGYLKLKIDEYYYLNHRVIWLYVYGYCPEHTIDHKDRIRTHNWLTNLRERTLSCNIKNSGNNIRNKSGVKGVFFDTSCPKHPWRTTIHIDKKLYTIGRFKYFKEAVCTRLTMEQCLNWEHCDSNSPAYQYVKNNIQN